MKLQDLNHWRLVRNVIKIFSLFLVIVSCKAQEQVNNNDSQEIYYNVVNHVVANYDFSDKRKKILQKYIEDGKHTSKEIEGYLTKMKLNHLQLYTRTDNQNLKLFLEKNEQGEILKEYFSTSALKKFDADKLPQLSFQKELLDQNIQLVENAPYHLFSSPIIIDNRMFFLQTIIYGFNNSYTNAYIVEIEDGEDFKILKTFYVN